MLLSIAKNVSIGCGLWLDCRGNLVIGENTSINPGCHLDNRGGIFIGSNVSLSPGVHVITADHDMRCAMATGRLGAVRIENHVFIGANAIVLKGVTLGEGSAVAAGSVVTKSVAPYTIVAGVPAIHVGARPNPLLYETSYTRHFW